MRLSSIVLPLCSSSCFLKIAFCSFAVPTVLAFLKWSFSTSSRHSISLPSGISMLSSSIGHVSSAGMYTYLKPLLGDMMREVRSTAQSSCCRCDLLGLPSKWKLREGSAAFRFFFCAEKARFARLSFKINHK